MTLRTALALIAALASAPGLDAHRLDEYLQATRVGVSRGRIDVELDLTPGVAVAAQVFGAIDTDGDGAVSAAEGRAYASAVIRALALELDGRPARATLEGARFPALEEMTRGIGTIRLTASLPATRAFGRHVLRIRNDHRAEISVYLVNALVPADTGIEIRSQTRDRLQHELRLEYRITPASSTMAGTGVVALLALVVWRGRPRLRPSLRMVR